MRCCCSCRAINQPQRRETNSQTAFSKLVVVVVVVVAAVVVVAVAVAVAVVVAVAVAVAVVVVVRQESNVLFPGALPLRLPGSADNIFL